MTALERVGTRFPAKSVFWRVNFAHPLTDGIMRGAKSAAKLSLQLGFLRPMAAIGGRFTRMQGYDENAKELATRYESIVFADMYRNVRHLFPCSPSRVLDIGAGSGRDAAMFALNGHSVVAVEPTASLRQEGMRIHDGEAIEWVDDRLPFLAQLKTRGGRFDFILLTAVWMHLDETERREAMASLADLIEPSGRISMSLRHGPAPTGRRMFEVSVAETIELAALFGFRAIHTIKQEDVQGRSDVCWDFIVFEKMIRQTK